MSDTVVPPDTVGESGAGTERNVVSGGTAMMFGPSSEAIDRATVDAFAMAIWLAVQRIRDGHNLPPLHLSFADGTTVAVVVCKP